MAAGPSGAFALNVNALTQLKQTAHEKPDAGLRQAARQFEAQFIKQMLSAAREATPESGLLNSTAQNQYRDMMDAQWSQTLAQRGMGLADMLVQQLGGHGGPAAATEPAVADKMAPKPLAPSKSLAAIKAQRTAARADGPGSARPHDSGPLFGNQRTAAPLVSLNASVDNAGSDRKVASYVHSFVNLLSAPAERVARKTGLPKRLVLAQAALETGWGRHEIMTHSGSSSFNVFNIKSGGWDGASTDAATREFTDGAMRKTRDGFRVYHSYDQAFSDYARLINSSPRYAAARQASSPEAAAQALQDGGYATDPNYADKLVAIMRALPEPSAQGGLFADLGGPVVDMNGHGGPIL